MIIKHFSELTNVELYEIIKQRMQVFFIEQGFVCQDLDDNDLDSYHVFKMIDQKVVAYLRILKKGVKYPDVSIGRVLVAREYRRKKLAEQCLKSAISFIEDAMSKTRIIVSSQMYITKLYEKVGFKIISEPYIEDGVEHVKMIYDKSLDL